MLLDAVKKRLQHAQGTLEAVIAARNQACSRSNKVVSRPGKAEAVFALANACSALKTDLTIRELSQALTGIENKVVFERQGYNDTVLDYNNAQGQFSALLVACLFGFVPSAMLRAIKSAVQRQVLRVQL